MTPVRGSSDGVKDRQEKTTAPQTPGAVPWSRRRGSTASCVDAAASRRERGMLPTASAAVGSACGLTGALSDTGSSWLPV
jgi:hypothetical protein